MWALNQRRLPYRKSLMGGICFCPWLLLFLLSQWISLSYGDESPKLKLIVRVKSSLGFTLSLCQISFLYSDIFTAPHLPKLFFPVWQLIYVSAGHHRMPRYLAEHCFWMCLWASFRKTLAFELVDWVHRIDHPNVGGPEKYKRCKKGGCALCLSEYVSVCLSLST